MGIVEALQKGLNYLEKSEYTNPFLETKLILEYLLGKDSSYFVSHGDEELDRVVEERYFEILKRRKSGEPLQYIIGEVNFYGHKFLVDKGVLIPRNDTEKSVEVLISLFKENNVKNFLEIGCGTGVVSITMALKYKSSKFTSVDISESALRNTLKNIKLHKVENIDLIKSDLYSNVNGSYDIIYSNPPYIKSGDIETLQEEVRYFEPLNALDGGTDGLDFYRNIVRGANKYLNERGFLVFEIGYNQADDLKKILAGYDVSIYRDLSGNDRVVVASKGV